MITIGYLLGKRSKRGNQIWRRGSDGKTASCNLAESGSIPERCYDRAWPSLVWRDIWDVENGGSNPPALIIWKKEIGCGGNYDYKSI